MDVEAVLIIKHATLANLVLSWEPLLALIRLAWSAQIIASCVHSTIKASQSAKLVFKSTILSAIALSVY